MSPDTLHEPARGLKGFCNFAVTLPVTFYFLSPILLIGIRYREVFRAPVPEATVNEDSNLGLSMDYVGAPWKVTDMIIEVSRIFGLQGLNHQILDL